MRCSVVQRDLTLNADETDSSHPEEKWTFESTYSSQFRYFTLPFNFN